MTKKELCHHLLLLRSVMREHSSDKEILDEICKVLVMEIKNERR